MKITESKSIIIKELDIFMILKEYFTSHGYNVANINYLCNDFGLDSATVTMVDESKELE